MSSVQFENLCNSYFFEWKMPDSLEDGLLIAARIISMITLVPAACVGLAYISVVAYNYYGLSEEDKKVYDKGTEILDTKKPPIPVDKPNSKPLPELPQEPIPFYDWLNKKLPLDMDELIGTYSSASQKLEKSPIVCYGGGIAIKVNIKQVDPNDKNGIIQDASINLDLKIEDEVSPADGHMTMYFLATPSFQVKTKDNLIHSHGFPFTFFGKSNFVLTPEKAKRFASVENKTEIYGSETLNWLVFRLLSGLSVRIEYNDWESSKFFPTFEITLASAS